MTYGNALVLCVLFAVSVRIVGVTFHELLVYNKKVSCRKRIARQHSCQKFGLLRGRGRPWKIPLLSFGHHAKSGCCFLCRVCSKSPPSPILGKLCPVPCDGGVADPRTRQLNFHGQRCMLSEKEKRPFAAAYSGVNFAKAIALVSAATMDSSVAVSLSPMRVVSGVYRRAFYCPLCTSYSWGTNDVKDVFLIRLVHSKWEKRSERREHCALAVVRRSQKISPRRRPTSRGRRTAKI